MMISLKLSRDRARCIEEVMFPLIRATAELHVREKLQIIGQYENEYLTAKILLTLIAEVDVIFKRKLLGQAKEFKFNFNDAQAITFYKFLMNHPIGPVEIYLLNLRQHVCQILHKQFYKP